MPQAGVALAIGEFLGFVGATATIVGSIALIGASYVVSRTINGNAQRNQPGDQGGRVQLPPATSNYAPVIYGSAFANGIIIDANIGSENKTMTYCLVLSEKTQTGSFTCGRTSGFGGDLSDIYWNDERLVFDSTDKSKVIKTVKSVDAENDTVSDNLNGLVRVWLYDGNSSTPFVGWDQSLAYNRMLEWTSSHKMSGFVFAIVEINYKQDKGVTGLPTLTFDITNSLTKPGDVFKDYATSIRYGAGIPLDEIDLSTVTALNTWSDTIPANQLTKDNTADTTTPRYRINGILDTSLSVKDNMDRILQNSASWLSYNVVAGLWRIVMKKAVTIDNTALSFSDSNILSGIALSATNLTDLYNDLEVEYVDRYNKDQRAYAHPSMSGIVKNPNEPDNKLSMVLDLTNKNVQAERVGLIELKQTRQDLVITFTASHYGIQAQAGDVIKLTNQIYGWTDKLFRISRVKEVESSEGALAVEITALEYNADVYSDESMKDFSLVKRIGIGAINGRTNGAKPIVEIPQDGFNSLATIPNFTIRTTFPTVGGPWDEIKLYYTEAGGNTTPAVTDYKYFASLFPDAGSDGFLPNVSPLPSLLANRKYKDQKYAGIPANTTGSNNYFVRAQVGFRGVFGEFSDAASFHWDPSIVTSTELLAQNIIFNPNPVLVPATNAGVVTQTGQTIDLLIQLGTRVAQLTTATTDATMPNDTWRLASFSAGTGLTVTGPSYDTNADKITWTITGLTTDSNTLSATLIYKDSSGVVSNLGSRSVGITKLKNGVDGVSSPLLLLTSDTEVIKVSKTNVLTPATITLTAVQGGSVTGTPTFTISPTGAITGGLVGTGLTRTYSPTNQTVDQVRITATNGIYQDTITITKIFEGLDGAGGLVGFLTNEYAGVAADSTGFISPINYDQAVTLFKIYEGIVETTQDWTFSQFSVSPASSITGAFSSQNQTNKNRYQVTAMNGAVDVANVTLRATKGTLTIDKVFTIAKQKQGAAGADAKIVRLTTAFQTFTYNAGGTTPSPANAVVSATAQNVGYSGQVSVYYEFILGSTSVQNDTRNTYVYTPNNLFTNMPQTITVNVREGSNSSNIVASDKLSMMATRPGDAGRQSVNVELYLWSTVDPTTSSPPIGTTNYNWTASTHSVNSISNGWTTSVPSNPGTSGIKLWVAEKQLTDVATATQSTITWASGGSTIYSNTMNGNNGANGTKTAFAEVYQWAASLPAPPTGTGTYTWSSSSFLAPGSWSLTITSAPSAGYTLWKAKVSVQDTATATTTTFNWGNSVLVASGYAGQTGAKGDTGNPGGQGNAGLSSRIAYTKTTLSSLASSPLTISKAGNTTFPDAGSWGSGTSWSGSPSTLVAGESLYQSDGIYDPQTGNTVWNVPYLSSLKVGSLSAITANMGKLTSGEISVTSSGYSEPTATGVYDAQRQEFVTTMTGRGTRLYGDGGFALGTPETNITYIPPQGGLYGKIFLNGDIVATGNLQANSVNTPLYAEGLYGQSFSPGSANKPYLNTGTAYYPAGTTINMFVYVSIENTSGGDCNLAMAAYNGSTFTTFAGSRSTDANDYQRYIQTAGPSNDKIVLTYIGSYTIPANGNYSFWTEMWNSWYNGTFTSKKTNIVVIGAKR
jgi:hypothetical protein